MKKLLLGLTLCLVGFLGNITMYIITGMRCIAGSFAYFYVTDFLDTKIGIIVFSLIMIGGIVIALWEIFEGKEK